MMNAPKDVLLMRADEENMALEITIRQLLLLPSERDASFAVAHFFSHGRCCWKLTYKLEA